MQKVFFSLLSIILLLFPIQAAAQGEQPQLLLNLRRDFGYGGFDNRIQGLFSLHAESSADLLEVDFYIDDVLFASIDEAPFRVQFATGDYASGAHILSARGTARGGEILLSNEILKVFLTADEARNATISLVVPLLGVGAVLALLANFIPRLIWKDRPNKIGEYGAAGGAICRNCGKPFSRHAWMPNLLVGKLERCPHCGKWALAPRAAPDDLKRAEARLLADEEAGTGLSTGKSEEERLKNQIDESRYDD